MRARESDFSVIEIVILGCPSSRSPQAIFYMLRHEPSSVTGRLFVFCPVGLRPVGIGRGDDWCALRRRARAGIRLSIISYGPILVALTHSRARPHLAQDDPLAQP